LSAAEPDFGASYDKARRAYGLAAAILLAWELIGIDLGEAPIESLKITLKSPHAAPYVLIALVVYFGFRLTVEWYQTEPRRRQRPASRVDFAVAHALGLVAVLLYVGQTLLRAQLADKLQLEQSAFTPLITGFLFGQWLAFILTLPHFRRRRIAAPGFLALLLLYLGWQIKTTSVNFWLLGSSFLLTFAFFAAIQMFAKRGRS